ncbi:rhodanese-like domain-containing protein [Pseudaestuariivita sp.]|uniref:rhodanese-like domain-containing protein n=1 Tax=Pseudaestuariivita sp. TaxID=2211669 RepID=UPI0040597E7E
MQITRRTMMLGTGAVVAAGAATWALRPAHGGADLTPAQAHAAARAGDLLLVDIRRPDEWAATGVGEGAVPLDMRRRDFIDALRQLTGGDTGARIAVMCARGVRSDRMARRLAAAGFTQIVDVPEGMLGSRAGPGWIKAGLPVVRP